jgi:pyridoxine 5-phosphate synthase
VTLLSVNLNKVCLMRNARGTGVPDLTDAARLVLAAGCGGLTLHPREDERHATLDDVRTLAALPQVKDGSVELNVEGDSRRELMAVAREVGATQFTVVPVVPGEVTTNHGWADRRHLPLLKDTVAFFDGTDTRLSFFVDTGAAGVELSAEAGADAVELHTYDYAHAFGTPRQGEVLERYVATAERARELGLQVNAGHDLDLDNLATFLEAVQPHEVSIGHALITEALLRALPGVTADYLALTGNA